MIDVETTSGLSASQVAARVDTWIKRVEHRLGRRPIIYTGSYFWRDRVGGSSAFADHPLWIAQYTNLCPRLPSPGRAWTFWQHSDRGRVAGIAGPTDLNHFAGDRDALAALIAASYLP